MSHYGPPPPPTGPGQPFYPYSGAPGPAEPPPAAPRPAGVAAQLGERLLRRPEPRPMVALAGMGAALTLFGVLLWGGSYFADAVSSDSFSGSGDRRLLGAGLAALAVVAGYVVLVTRRTGALSTAAAVSAGVGLPLTIGFLTLDLSGTASGFPFSVDAVFWVSAVVWAVSYLVVPGARGRTFFVFLIATGLYVYLLSKNASSPSVRLVFGSGGPGFHGLGTIAAIGLVLGLGYYLIAFLLDRTGRHGPATGLVYPAFAATASGIIAWSPDLHAVGTGIVTIVVGTVVCWYAGSFGRRLTCFAATVAIAVGIGVLIAHAAPHNGSAAGVAFLLTGLVVVAAAGLLSAVFGERSDMDAEAVVRSR